jgi:hypothetical protein
MKKILFVVAILIVILGFKSYKGVEGNQFPTMVCEDYNGKKVTLPADTKGKYSVLGMAFSAGAEDDLKTWLSPIYNKFVAYKTQPNDDPFAPQIDYDINLYFVPMFTGLNQLTSKTSKEKIKSLTDKDLYQYLLFYEGDKTYKEELDFAKKDTPYFFVLDKTGKIVYATFGRYDEKKLDKIVDIVEEN